MGQDPRQTVVEIEQTREDLARKVDLLVDRAKVEAGEIGRKVAIGAVAIVGLIVVGMIAKRRVRR
jgi:aromatic ring hydroxylase